MNELLAALREKLADYKPSRERSLVQTKIDEAELWLSRCELSAAHPFSEKCDGFHPAGRDCNLPEES